MSIQAFITKLESLDPWEIQQFFDKDNGGSCPCFSGRKTIEGKVLAVWGRCWRVSDNVQDLHIKGTLDDKALKKVARIIKRKLDAQKWYNPYTIIYDEFET